MAFIKIEQDTLLLTDVFNEDGPGRIELREDQMKQIIHSRLGHAQFMYIDGELVESPDVLDYAFTSTARP